MMHMLKSVHGWHAMCLYMLPSTQMYVNVCERNRVTPLQKQLHVGKQAFDDWMKKQQRKKDSKSSYNLAFGRRNHSNSMTSPDDIERQRTKKSGTFLKSVRGKLSESICQ